MKNIILSLVLISSFAHAQLLTVAEKTSWKETGRAFETEILCHKFQKKFPDRVQCQSYGKTPEGRNLMYMVLGSLKDPVVWVQAGIHAGEIDGKDAVFLLLRRVLEEKMKPDPLKGICLVFIPIVNLDGHERFGKWNRPNQVGPEEMGWRTTAQNLNLNRDFVKVDAPEMIDLLKLWHKVDPVLSLDLHVTNGAQFQPEVGLIILPNTFYGKSELHFAGKVFEDELLMKMKERGRLALPFYPSFLTEDDPSTGFSRGVSSPRFSHGYWSTNNRLGMLVESHSWKDYATRVKVHYDTVLSTLELMQTHGKAWKTIEQKLDHQSLAETVVELDYDHTQNSRPIDFPGYKYSKEKSIISGEKVIKYDPSSPEIWKVPFYEEIVPILSSTAPLKGYFIPSTEVSWVLKKLDYHNIKHTMIKKPELKELQVFRATKTEFSPKSFEGHQTLKVEGLWNKEKVHVNAGSIFVSIDQPKARLIVQIFEPMAQDSFLSWGFFNRYFEMKEYMENYVVEDVATEMLKQKDIRTEFEAKMKSNTDFAKSSEKRVQFFYQKHPSWDERFNRYPVLKL